MDRMENNRIDPSHECPRNFFRTAGPLLMALGGILLLISIINFFATFGGMEPPRLFWCAFAGIPLLAIGGMMTQAGYAGRIMRYMAQESAPVAKDTFNYIADGTQEGVRKVSQAVGEGLAGGMQGWDSSRPPAVSAPQIRCPKCNSLNDEKARFCNQCGKAIAKTKSCPTCMELNDPDAFFCSNCGHGFNKTN